MPRDPGKEVWGGCIRTYPEGVEHLYPIVALDAPVAIVDEPYKVGWPGQDLYLATQTGEKSVVQSPHTFIPGSIANDLAVTVDWPLVEKVVEEDTGIPTVTGQRRNAAGRAGLPMIF